MGRALTEQEFGILKEHVDASDRIAYYEQLAKWGYSYGSLALSVVNNDAMAGITANIYVTGYAARYGVNLSDDVIGQLSLDLMRKV